MVACGEEHAGFITNSNLIYMMGSNSEGQLGIGDKGSIYKNSPVLIDDLVNKKPCFLACGSNHTAALTDKGELFTWGCGVTGALGIGDIVNQWSPKQVVLYDRGRQPYFNYVACGS